MPAWDDVLKPSGNFVRPSVFGPSYVDAHLGLGKVLLEEGRKDEARIAFERVIALAPGSDIAADVREQLKSLAPLAGGWYAG
jgi:hypothetical protein